MKKYTKGAIRFAILAGAFGLACPVRAQIAADQDQINGLRQLNGAIETLVHRVSRSVVQVQVTSYGPPEDRSHNDAMFMSHQNRVGAGVVIDAGGYIMTNAHVVENARRVQIVVTSEDGSIGPAMSRHYDATVIGSARELDLALLKVDGLALPALPIAATNAVHQGQLVFAFGSPGGFDDSVTMGIVSAVRRQVHPDDPLVYIQTDAPINPGSSGGALVDVRGDLVGINTFVMSTSAGSQGLGFAIPGTLVQLIYPKLRQYGSLRRGELGIHFQAVTPRLAAGLGLSQDWGALIGDVMPNSPAESAGLRIGDIVVGVDGERVVRLPQLIFQLYTRTAGEHAKVDVLRGEGVVTFDVTFAERPSDIDDLSALVDPEKNLVARLGIVAVELDEETLSLAKPLRIPYGVIVVGHVRQDAGPAAAGITVGDTIHSINGIAVTSVADLNIVVDSLKSGSPVVLQIERDGQLNYVSFDLQ